jgi:hypothetical protein
MTFAMRQSVNDGAGEQECLSAELTFIDAKCEADHPAPECPVQEKAAAPAPICAVHASATELPLVVFGLRLRADPGTCERRALLVGAPCETGVCLTSR